RQARALEPPLGQLRRRAVEERLDLAGSCGLELAADHGARERRRRVGALVGEAHREAAGHALPPPLARRTLPGDLADEVVAGEVAQVVARRPARLADELGEPARGERAVRREQVE